MTRTIELPRAERDGRSALDAPALTSVRCLVVDDHPAVRAGLRALLAAESGFKVVEAVATAEAALAFAQRSSVDVAIVDYQLGRRSGLWLSRKLKQLTDPPAVLVYSAFSDYLLGAACVVAGADGMVSKAALGGELCDRIREVAAGQTCLPLVPPVLADRLRRRFDSREQTIFGMMSARIPVREIARTLGFAQGELEGMLWAMLSKLERIEPVPGRYDA